MNKPSERFNEVIQRMTPLCMTSGNMEIIRAVKNLQEYTEFLEGHVDSLTALVKEQVKS